MKAIPRRMRERIVALYDQRRPTREIAEVMGTCRSATRRVRQYLRQRGTLEPLAATGGYAGKLTEDLATRLRRLVAEDPGATRQKLRDCLGVSVDVRTVGRWLRKLGLVLKKSRSRPPSGSGPTSKSVVTSGTNH